jgi:endonuclease/exonuclease/phosphatase family metal-dependent hydrolase
MHTTYLQEGFDGLGLLSKLPVLRHEAVLLPNHARWSTDNNARCVMMTELVMGVEPSDPALQVFVAHLSYADTQQCLNTAGLLYYANSKLQPRYVCVVYVHTI